MVLERELKTYEQHKDDLLAHNDGQYVVIFGDQIIGAFSTFEEAYKAGVAKCGTLPFLMQPVTKHQALIQFPALTVGMIHAHP